jgi:hypothetical protein
MKRSVLAWSTVFSVLKAIPAILACVVFLCSMALPFYHADYSGVGLDMPVTHSLIDYWSFRSFNTKITSFEGGWIPDQVHESIDRVDYWFSDCWFNDSSIVKPNLSRVFTTIFITQILTFAIGVASIFVRKRLLALAPVILCVIATLLMIYASNQLSTLTPYGSGLQLGYWLNYLSMLLFLGAFILSARDMTKTIEKNRPLLALSFLVLQKSYLLNPIRIGLTERKALQAFRSSL